MIKLLDGRVLEFVLAKLVGALELLIAWLNVFAGLGVVHVVEQIAILHGLLEVVYFDLFLLLFLVLLLLFLQLLKTLRLPDSLGLSLCPLVIKR